MNVNTLAEKLTCPACHGIANIKTCPGCGGQPPLGDDEPCGVCGGAGQIEDPTHCTLCKGQGIITRALFRLSEADKYVRREDAGWNGDDLNRPGIAYYSLAKWYRNRDRLSGRVVGARGYFGYLPKGESRTKEPIVELILSGHDGPEFFPLYGVNWGYRGTGAIGLAYILTDAGLVSDCKKAKALVFSLPHMTIKDAWGIGAHGDKHIRKEEEAEV